MSFFKQLIDKKKETAYMQELKGRKMADVIGEFGITKQALHLQKNTFIETAYSNYQEHFDQIAEEADGSHADLMTDDALDLSIYRLVFGAKYPGLTLSDSRVFDMSLIEKVDEALDNIHEFPYKTYDLAKDIGINKNALLSLLKLSDKKILYGSIFIYGHYPRSPNYMIAVNTIAQVKDYNATSIYRFLSGDIIGFREQYPTLESFKIKIKKMGLQNKTQNPLTAFGFYAKGYESINYLLKKFAVNDVEKVIESAYAFMQESGCISTTKLIHEHLTEIGVPFPDDYAFLKSILVARSDLFEGGRKLNIRIKDSDCRFKTLEEHISDVFKATGEDVLSSTQVWKYLTENIYEGFEHSNVSMVIANKFKREHRKSGYVYFDERIEHLSDAVGDEWLSEKIANFGLK